MICMIDSSNDGIWPIMNFTQLILTDAWSQIMEMSLIKLLVMRRLKDWWFYRNSTRTWGHICWIPFKNLELVKDLNLFGSEVEDNLALVHKGNQKLSRDKISQMIEEAWRCRNLSWRNSETFQKTIEDNKFARKVIEEKCFEECLEILQPMGD